MSSPVSELKWEAATTLAPKVVLDIFYDRNDELDVNYVVV